MTVQRTRSILRESTACHAPRARAAFIALLVLFGTLSAGWLTLARSREWAAFARWFVDLPLT